MASYRKQRPRLLWQLQYEWGWEGVPGGGPPVARLFQTHTGRRMGHHLSLSLRGTTRPLPQRRADGSPGCGAPTLWDAAVCFYGLKCSESVSSLAGRLKIGSECVRQKARRRDLPLTARINSTQTHLVENAPSQVAPSKWFWELGDGSWCAGFSQWRAEKGPCDCPPLWSATRSHWSVNWSDRPLWDSSGSPPVWGISECLKWNI